MRVCLYQGGDSGSVASNMDTLARVLSHHASMADLFVFPELFTGGYVEPPFGADDWSEDALAALAKRYGVAVCVGVCTKCDDDDSKWLNQTVLVDAHGKTLLRHTKTHLWGDHERKYFRPGSVLPPICQLGDFKVASVICYEVEFAEMIRYLGKQGVDLVLVPTAVASDLPGLSMLTDRLIPTRAVENNLWICYANRCGREGGLTFLGRSTIASPHGEVAIQMGSEPGVSPSFQLTKVAVQQSRDSHPFLVDLREDLFRNAVHETSKVL